MLGRCSRWGIQRQMWSSPRLSTLFAGQMGFDGEGAGARVLCLAGHCHAGPNRADRARSTMALNVLVVVRGHCLAAGAARGAGGLYVTDPSQCGACIADRVRAYSLPAGAVSCRSGRGGRSDSRAAHRLRRHLVPKALLLRSLWLLRSAVAPAYGAVLLALGLRPADLQIPNRKQLIPTL